MFRREEIQFWCWLATQAACSQFLIWYGVPIYRRLHAADPQGATPTDLALVLVAVVVMQSAYWLAFRVQPRVRFGRNVVLGHGLIWIGELSLFFSAAVAVFILFDRGGELEFTFWKLFTLAAILFAVSCYKHQLMSLGDTLINAEAGKT